MYKRQAEDELPDGLVARAAVDELNGRDDDPFLVQLGREPVSYTHLTLPTSDLV